MKNPGDILAFLIDREGITQNELARITKVPQPTIYRIISKISKNPRADKLRPLADYFGVSLAQLMGDVPLDFESDDVQAVSKFEGRVPLISWVQAGEWCEAMDTFHPGDAEEWLPSPTNLGPRGYALRIVGDSMTSPYPGRRSYPEGVIIFVDPDIPATPPCRVIAKLKSKNYVTFKELVRDAGDLRLMPINPAHKAIDVTDDVVVCGVVVGSYMPE